MSKQITTKTTTLNLIAELKKKFAAQQAEIDAKIVSVAATDASVAVGGTATAPTVAVQISAESGNILELKDDGISVVPDSAAEYSIEKAADSSDYAAVYNLTKDGVATGATINIPKDMVVQSGDVVTDPEGQEAGTYLHLVLANADNSDIYINVGDLIEYVTSGSAEGDMIVVTVDGASHEVTAAITDGTITNAKLASDVQASLGLADTALQESDIEDYTAAEIEALFTDAD